MLQFLRELDVHCLSWLPLKRVWYSELPVMASDEEDSMVDFKEVGALYRAASGFR